MTHLSTIELSVVIRLLCYAVTAPALVYMAFQRRDRIASLMFFALAFERAFFGVVLAMDVIRPDRALGNHATLTPFSVIMVVIVAIGVMRQFRITNKIRSVILMLHLPI